MVIKSSESRKYLYNENFLPQILENSYEDKQYLVKLADENNWSEFEREYPSERSVFPGDVIRFRAKNETYEYTVETNSYLDEVIIALQSKYGDIEIEEDEMDLEYLTPKIIISTFESISQYNSKVTIYEWLPRYLYQQTVKYEKIHSDVLILVTHFENATDFYNNMLVTPQPLLYESSFSQVPKKLIHTVASTIELEKSNLGPVQLRIDINDFINYKNWNIYYLCNLDFNKHIAVKMLVTTKEYKNLCPYDYTIKGGPWFFDGEKHYLALAVVIVPSRVPSLLVHSLVVISTFVMDHFSPLLTLMLVYVSVLLLLYLLIELILKSLSLDQRLNSCAPFFYVLVKSLVFFLFLYLKVSLLLLNHHR